ncbi:hypothetical protein PR002_g22251 [Phytophthora rubi]|uniref:Uncharacterized protein n=1 Tax=Phytophthora rubi TaxID=129364 RepID=A0A6A3IYF8_9STRA|nr:hypothetical protein PR002_g22251 [Phytophthora rubi]
MAASKCNPIKNIAEVGARDVQTVADETCADLAPSTDEKGSRSATAGVESPVCDNAGPVCVTKNLVGVVQRGDPHAGDAEAQQTQLPEATATDKDIKTEEAGVTDKEIKTEEAGVTDK